jgi:outer membrane protein
MAERTPVTRPAAARTSGPAPHAASRATSRARRVRGTAALQVLAAAGLTAAGFLAAGLTAGGVGGCGQYDAPLFDPRALELAERRSAVGQVPATMESYPSGLQPITTPRGGVGGGPRPATQAYLATLPTTGPSYQEKDTVPLSLREVIARAVLYNSEVKVAGYDPAINASRVIEAEAQFDVSVFANLRTERNDPGLSTTGQVAANTLIGFNDKTKTNTVETGFSQRLPWGGQGRILYGLSWNEVDNLPANGSNNGTRDSFWQNQVRLEVTQPLLLNFGRDINSARIEIARLDQRISLQDFRRTLEEQLSELERAYWQLYQSMKIVEIQENLLADTIETYRVLFERYSKGLDASEIPVSQAQSSVKARQADLIRAKQNARDLSTEVKRRMNDPAFPVASEMMVYPSEEPLKEPVQFDYGAAIDAAGYNRFELGQQRARIEQARVAERVALNNLLPRLDLVTRIGVVGLGDTTGEAVKNNFDFNSPSWSFGLEFEYPIGNRAALSILNRARLQRLQAVEQYRSLLAQVSQDVQVSMSGIYSSWHQSIARSQARLASARQLSLIQKQQDLGEPITPSFIQVKLQNQEELANNSREEVSALADYNINIQRLERAKGTLLKYNNVQLKEDPSQTYLRRSWVEDGMNR